MLQFLFIIYKRFWITRMDIFSDYHGNIFQLIVVNGDWFCKWLAAIGFFKVMLRWIAVADVKTVVSPLVTRDTTVFQEATKVSFDGRAFFHFWLSSSSNEHLMAHEWEPEERQPSWRLSQYQKHRAISCASAHDWHLPNAHWPEWAVDCASKLWKIICTNPSQCPIGLLMTPKLKLWEIYWKTWYGWSSWAPIVKLLSGECHRIYLWWEVNIGSGNGLVPSGNKPLPEPMLT